MVTFDKHANLAYGQVSTPPPATGGTANQTAGWTQSNLQWGSAGLVLQT